MNKDEQQETPQKILTIDIDNGPAAIPQFVKVGLLNRKEAYYHHLVQSFENNDFLKYLVTIHDLRKSHEIKFECHSSCCGLPFHVERFEHFLSAYAKDIASISTYMNAHKY